MSVSVTLFVLHWDVSPRVAPLHHCVTSVFLCLGGIHVGLSDLVCTSLRCIPTGCTVTSLRDLGRFRIPPAGLPYIWSRAPRWPPSCYLMYL